MTRVVQVCPDPEVVARVVSDRVAAASVEAIARTGRFTIALSGGSAPQGAFARLASDDLRDEIEWERTHVFWGDERCIPLSRPDNHFTMASALFLNDVPISDANVHRARGEADDVQQAAREYDHELARVFELRDGEMPRFDFMLQGLGDDGHTASLYPGSEGLTVRDRRVVAHWVQQREGYRITMTYPVLNAAREVCFVALGAEKADALAGVLRGDPAMPAAGVTPRNAVVRFVVDEAAAKLPAELADEVQRFDQSTVIGRL